MRRFCAGILTLLALAGCGHDANWSSVYREYSLQGNPAPKTVLIDAKERAIIAKEMQPPSSFQTKPYSVAASTTVAPTTGASQTADFTSRLPKSVAVCAEPSPDAFATVGESFATSGSFSGTSHEVQLALSLALAESAGQFRRARTIQLLRDGLYRACEAYINGAISATAYGEVLNKYADATVTLLAIEQITPQDITPPVQLSSGDTTISNGPIAKTNATGQDTTTGGATDNSESANKNNATGQDSSTTDKTTGSNSKTTGDSGTTSQKTAQGGNGQTPRPPAQNQSSNQAAPTDAAVSAVQYMVGNFLLDTLQNRCFDVYAGTEYVRPESAAVVKSFCDTLFNAKLQTLPTGNSSADTPNSSPQKTGSSTNQSTKGQSTTGQSTTGQSTTNQSATSRLKQTPAPYQWK